MIASLEPKVSDMSANRYRGNDFYRITTNPISLSRQSSNNHYLIYDFINLRCHIFLSYTYYINIAVLVQI